MAKLKVGDKAPLFSLPDVKNRIRSLQEFLGQKVVLVFFIGAFTSSCTKERCEFRDSMSRLINLKAQVVGIDVKVPTSIKSSSEKFRLPFPVLSDKKREVIEQYGLAFKDNLYICCVGEGCHAIANRSIFVLDEGGIVRYSWISNTQADEPNYDEIERILEPPVFEEPSISSLYTNITISRQMGSGGDEVALEVGNILGYAIFDKNLLVNAARSLGVSDEDIADCSEDSYKIKSVVDKILLRKKPFVVPLVPEVNAPVKKVLDEEDCLSVIQTVITNLASRGKTVIVGRGGQAILKDKAGVLHVRIIACKEERVKRVMMNQGVSHRAALKLVNDNDSTTAEYLHRFYSVDLEDPTNYDIVLNTSKIDVNTASKVIASIVSSRTQW